jgi:hypothetical protein
MSSLVSYEPLVDSTTIAFLEQTQKLFCDTRTSCNFSEWLQFYAFDVIGELTWSKRLGFVDKNEDVDGIVQFLNRFLAYAGPVSGRRIIFLSNSIDQALDRPNAYIGSIDAEESYEVTP